jgi:hypothetical protein
LEFVGVVDLFWDELYLILLVSGCFGDGSVVLLSSCFCGNIARISTQFLNSPELAVIV